jgi:hypothetical protein
MDNQRVELREEVARAIGRVDERAKITNQEAAMRNDATGHLPQMQIDLLIADAAIALIVERCAQVADGSWRADKATEAEYLASAEADGSIAGKQVYMEYSVSFARRASGSAAIATAIRQLATQPEARP